MPRFVFRLFKDGRDPDSFDVDLIGLDDAREEAARFFAEELKDYPSDLWSDRQWRVEVADEHGVALFNIAGSATDAP